MTDQERQHRGTQSAGSLESAETDALVEVERQIESLLAGVESGQLGAGAGLVQRLEGVLIALRVARGDHRPQ